MEEEPVKNLNKKLVGTLSQDHRTYTSQRKNCATIITANRDGTLNIVHKFVEFLKDKSSFIK